MRQGQHPKKNNRGRNRRQSNPGNRVFESNGPDVKIRGNASHVSEKYLTLARDAQASGDPIASENYLQHAEHYLRIIAASQAQQQAQNQPCAPDQEDQDRSGDGGRGDGQSQQRGRGRSNGDGRGNRNAAAQTDEAPNEDSAEDINGAAADEPAEDQQEQVVNDDADQVNGEDVVVTKASKDEPAADIAEEPVPEAS